MGLEFKLCDDWWETLNSGKGLRANGNAKDGALDNVYQGICKGEFSSPAIYNIVTHLMTRWNGRVDDERRALCLTPVEISSFPIGLLAGEFIAGNINYHIRIFETEVCRGDDYIHPSDVICTCAEGIFSADSKENFQKQYSEYFKLVNLLYQRFYQTESPTVILRFKPVEMDSLEFRNTINSHWKNRLTPNEQAEVDSEGLTQDIRRKIIDINIFPRREWDDIGGMFEPKQKIRVVLEGYYNPDLLRQLGVNPQINGGILFYGDKGNGKTLAAEAIATELEKKYGDGFVHLSGNYSSYASELRGGEVKNIRRFFDRIRQEQKKGKHVMAFLDEIQQTGRRYHSSRIAEESLDEILFQTNRMNYENVLLIGATALSLEQFDQQLLRPGRFGTHIEFPSPNHDERIDILQKAVLEAKRISANSKSKISDFCLEIDYETLARETEGFTLAETYFLLREIQGKKLLRISKGEGYMPLTTEDFLPVIQERKVAKANSTSFDDMTI